MIYLDNSATSFIYEEVLGVINDIYKNKNFNPSSAYDVALSVEKEMKKARKILDRKNITQPIRIGELCKIMNKTRYQLQISFEKVEGIGIFEYIQKRRMEYSKNLLITTNKSILEISNEVGYKNPSKFSKIFKKYYGILPSKYRNKD